MTDSSARWGREGNSPVESREYHADTRRRVCTARKRAILMSETSEFHETTEANAAVAAETSHDGSPELVGDVQTVDALVDDANGEDGGQAEDVTKPVAKRAERRDRTELLEREGEVAADFLERLLDIADLDGDIDVDIDGDRASVAIVDSDEGRVPRRLVGPDGKVLEALQELTRMAVQAATGERSRLMLDVAEFRAQRRQAVIDVTRRVIEEVRKTGQPMPLEPMTAFERKVAHDEVLAAGLSSESEGADPARRVVVLPT